MIRERIRRGYRFTLPIFPWLDFAWSIDNVKILMCNMIASRTYPAPLNGKRRPEAPGPPPMNKTTGAVSGFWRASKSL